MGWDDWILLIVSVAVAVYWRSPCGNPRGSDVAVGLLTFAAYLLVVTLVAIPLGRYLAAVYSGTAARAARVLGPLERSIYRVLRVDPEVEHGWRTYLGGLLAFNVVGFLILYALLRFQGSLPFNPEGLPGVSPWIAFNTAVSFVTNTNWQAYGGESTMSYLSQFAGLTVQNFVSAAVGMAAAAALIRSVARRHTDKIGNFWVDLVRVEPVRAAAHLPGVRLRPGQPGSRAELRRLRRGRHRRGSGAGDPGRARRRPGRHQGPGHQRRRVLQRQLGAPVREPDPVEQRGDHRGDAGHPGRPGRWRMVG